MEIDFARCEHGQEEINAVNRVLSGHWLASGKENEQFEIEFAKYHNRRHAVCVNSGSMANLLALASLNLPKGSKVVTSACGFPATLAPILHLGLEPVLVDYDIRTLNIDIHQVARAIKDNVPRAIILAHTLGNPVSTIGIRDVCDRYGVQIIEDCCESLGAKMYGHQVGGHSNLATYSFYPSHQITALGGGGMITTDSTELYMKLCSLRDWGKAWFWNSRLGKNNTSYDTQVDGLPYFQHYVYHTLGYNAKLPEANAAFGREQLKRLDGWVEKRRDNYNYIMERLKLLSTHFLFLHPHPMAEPSWFGFPLVVNNMSITRDVLSNKLEEAGIRTRPFFAGNITRHEPFSKYKGNFPVADRLMRDALFFGCYQGLGKTELDYICDTIISIVMESK